MTDPLDDDALDAWIDALAPVLGIAVPEEYRPGVRSNLAVAVQMAALLGETELPDDAEPAPVFTA